MDNAICIRTYDTNPKKTYPKQVALAEGETMVIGGSDDGFIYVFDKATSEWCHAPNTFGTVNMEHTIDLRLSWRLE